MSGSKTTIIDVQSKTSFQYRNRTVRPRLAIQCADKKTAELFVDLDFPISAVSQGRARIRFDQAPPANVTGTRSTDGSALFLPSAASTIRSLAKARDFMVEVTPVTGNPVVLEFNVAGLAKHRDALAGCGVKL